MERSALSLAEGAWSSIRPTPPAWNNLAIAYEHEGKFEEAKKAYEKALQLEPKNLLIRQNYDLFKEINDRTKRRAASSLVLVGQARARGLHRLLRDSDRNADPAEDGRVGVPARARRRLHQRRHRGRGREPRDGASAPQPAATKSPLRVIEAEVLPLAEIAADREQGPRGTTAEHDHHDVDRRRSPGAPMPTADDGAAARRRSRRTPKPEPTQARRSEGERADQEREGPAKYDKIFADVAVLEEARRGIPDAADRDRHGALHAAPGERLRDAEPRGLRLVRPPQRHPGAHLQGAQGLHPAAAFVFIDGRTGAILYSETFHEEILYNAQQSVPALSTYFELMDRVMPQLPQHPQRPEDPRHARPPQVSPEHLVNLRQR